ncbi:hypothetical protein [Pseudomonas sp. NPDC008258]|uniref:hypothetical protein n=1 Tax=Pseudomonas sp. NPDC008258 TaxID=3364418 RepID=UPI0036DFD1DA
MSSSISESELGVPLDYTIDQNDAIQSNVLSHMATHTQLPIDEEIYLRFNQPTTTLGMPNNFQNLELITTRYGAEWFNMARLNQLKRQS